MAVVDVTVRSDMTAQQAWGLASDLDRFDEWLTIFGGWRSAVPRVIEQGTKVSSRIKVKGFRNVIGWEVTAYDPPVCIAMRGRGRGGVRIALNVTVAADEHEAAGSTFRLRAELSGGLLGGPVGRLVARVITTDVHKSVTNLANLRRP